MLASIAGFVPALAIHFSVGYTDTLHLLPVYVGVLMVGIALLLSRNGFKINSGDWPQRNKFLRSCTVQEDERFRDFWVGWLELSYPPFMIDAWRFWIRSSSLRA
jgi:hypothetical protein